MRLALDLDRSIGQLVRGDDERGIDAAPIEWDGCRVRFLYADGGRSVLAAASLAGTSETLVDGDRAVLDFSSAAGRTAIAWSDPVTPGAVSVIERGDETLLVDLNELWAADVQLVEPAPVSAPTDRGRVEGWLTLPPSDADVPLVVQIHGGPHYPIGYRFSFDSHRLAGSGMGLLRLNPTGSQGYGRKHASLVGEWGRQDLDDLIAIVDVALQTPGVDHKRVAAMGESYGGFLALLAAARTNMFSAVVAENAVSDFGSIAQGPSGPSFWHLEFAGTPADQPRRYEERSPITHVGTIAAPILLIHAEDDQTVPIEQSERLAKRLGESGKDVIFHRVPDEGHFVNVFGAPSRRIGRTRLLDRFLSSRLSLPVGRLENAIDRR
jgi:dipeptidyl aminopeptidase/acylaminoacyl peptidase